jgi:hypothetical protein
MVPIRYRWRDKNTGELVSFEDGSGILITKKGTVCKSPPSGSRKPVLWNVPQPNLLLEVATYKVDNVWVYEPFTKAREKFTLAYRFEEDTDRIKKVFNHKARNKLKRKLKWFFRKSSLS